MYHFAKIYFVVVQRKIWVFTRLYYLRLEGLEFLATLTSSIVLATMFISLPECKLLNLQTNCLTVNAGHNLRHVQKFISDC